MASRARAGSDRSSPAPLVETAVFGTLLLVFWFALSGRTDAEHLGIGVVTCYGVAAATRRLLRVSWDGPAGSETRPLWDLPWPRFLAYLPWLTLEVAKANLQVAAIILSRRMPIDPHLIRVRQPLPGAVPRLILAHSITLTPGTVTVDVEGDEFVIHALTRSAAESLWTEGTCGEMPRRVRRLFAGNDGGEVG